MLSKVSLGRSIRNGIATSVTSEEARSSDSRVLRQALCVTPPASSTKEVTKLRNINEARRRPFVREM
jgi:hypothetical protein